MLGGVTEESRSALGRHGNNFVASGELVRDPSVQINLSENLYIDD